MNASITPNRYRRGADHEHRHKRLDKTVLIEGESALTEWFNRRFATAGKRMRRVGIVALARRLAIALWRYLQTGEIPGRRDAQAGRRVSSRGLRSKDGLAGDRNSMIKGRRARNVSGSLHGDRPKRWGAPLTGVGQRTCAHVG